ncbi:hypothetical protein CWE04_09830 [Thomasclavelia cocleata]|nr:hypothetical protein [Thomasclavelia cocleata]MCR1961427.1 hypothetical protein [Thomasclavelia cocleata]NDO40947.1 hypothetical protein [Thomasclavelia cocleata]PJN80226.1 hypothetical protein CWE04_09830 [Thomasclavelia cocleata]
MNNVNFLRNMGANALKDELYDLFDFKNTPTTSAFVQQSFQKKRSRKISIWNNDIRKKSMSGKAFFTSNTLDIDKFITVIKKISEISAMIMKKTNSTAFRTFNSGII